jgi:putative FmdB family regulatory protein
MPTYEYLCEKCGKNFEAYQSMKDNAFATCPKELCRKKTWGKGKVKRLLGAGAGLIFKGSGFYITDYRSSGYKEAAKKDSSSTSGGESKGTESKKPAASTEKSKPKKAKE